MLSVGKRAHPRREPKEAQTAALNATKSPAKVRKIKPTFPKNAHKVVTAIYKMYDEMSSIAIDLGKKKDSFMLNPDTWMLPPAKMVERGKYEILHGEEKDTI